MLEQRKVIALAAPPAPRIITLGSTNEFIAALKELQKKLEKMADELEKLNESSIGKMDELGHLELKIMETFSDFSALLEKISNKPEFDELILEEFNIPEFNAHEIEKVSTGAASLLAGASGMATGALGGFAAAGAAEKPKAAV